MPTKIRLQRHGKKGKPFYWIIAVDSRTKRDGKFLEKIGTYNPNTHPATINLDVDGAVRWLQNGAQPTDTARAILSYKGAMYKKHLLGGVAKGAFDEVEAEKRFQEWLTEKEAKIENTIKGITKSKAEAASTVLEAEKAVNEARINAAKDAENAAIKAEADAKDEAEAAAKAATEVEEVKPETIDDAAAAAANEGKPSEEVVEDTKEVGKDESEA